MEITIGAVFSADRKVVPISLIFEPLPEQFVLEIPPEAADPFRKGDGYTVMRGEVLGDVTDPDDLIVLAETNLLEDAFVHSDSAEAEPKARHSFLKLPEGSRGVKVLRGNNVFTLIRCGSDYLLLRSLQKGEEFERKPKARQDQPLSFFLDQIRSEMSVEILDQQGEETASVRLGYGPVIDFTLKEGTSATVLRDLDVASRLEGALSARNDAPSAGGLTGIVGFLERLETAQKSGNGLLDLSDRFARGMSDGLDETIERIKISASSEASGVRSAVLVRLPKGTVGVGCGEMEGRQFYLLRTPSGTTMLYHGYFTPTVQGAIPPEPIDGFLDVPTFDALFKDSPAPRGAVLRKAIIDDITPIVLGIEALKTSG